MFFFAFHYSVLPGSLQNLLAFAFSKQKQIVTIYMVLFLGQELVWKLQTGILAEAVQTVSECCEAPVVPERVAQGSFYIDG